MTKEFRQVELINYIQKYSFKMLKQRKKKWKCRNPNLSFVLSKATFQDYLAVHPERNRAQE